MPTRRELIQWAGAGIAAAATAGRGFAPAPAQAVEQSVTTASKRKFELGIASYTFMKFPLDKALAMTRRLGLKHICLKSFHLPLDSTPERIARVVAQVKAAGLDLYAGGVIVMSKPADVQQAFAYAKAVGMRVIVGMPQPAMLPLIDEHVQKYDICLAIHNHGPEDSTFPTPGSAYEKIKHLDHRVGLCIDVGHTACCGVDPSCAAQQCADRVFDVHMKDVTSATAHGAAVEIGRGVIDIPKFLRTLEQIGYGGIVSFEFEKDFDDPLPGLAESVGYVRGVLAAI